MQRIAAGKFKDQCLKILDRVSDTRDTVVVTKRGRPVACVVPYPALAQQRRTLKGSILRETGNLYATGEKWDADLS